MAFCIMAFTGCGSEETGTGTADNKTTPDTTVEATTTEPETTTTTPAETTPEPETTTAAVEESIAETDNTTAITEEQEEQADPYIMTVEECITMLISRYTDAEVIGVENSEGRFIIWKMSDGLEFILTEQGNGIIAKYENEEKTDIRDYNVEENSTTSGIVYVILYNPLLR